MSDERVVVSATPNVHLLLHKVELAKYGSWDLSDEPVFSTIVLSEDRLRDLVRHVLPTYTVPVHLTDQILMSIAGLLNRKLALGPVLFLGGDWNIRMPCWRVEVLRSS